MRGLNLIAIIILGTILVYWRINHIELGYSFLLVVVTEIFLIINAANIYSSHRKPKFLWRFVHLFRTYYISKKFDRIFDEGRKEDLEVNYIRLALNDLSSVDQKQRLSALAQLKQLGNNPNNVEVIYLGLINALKNEDDGLFRDSIIGTICHFRKCRNRNSRLWGK